MPKTVSIVGMGASRDDYLAARIVYGDRTDVVWDQVWAINAMGGAIVCDRVIHMDPLSLMEGDARWDRLYALWKKHGTPVYTSYPHPDMPNSVAYPIREVVADLKFPYFNNTVAYAVALAIYEKFDTIGLFGCDFTYADRHAAESGRACVEYWLARAKMSGINVMLADRTSIFDHAAGRPLYGYHLDPTVPESGANPTLNFDGVKQMLDQQAAGPAAEPGAVEPAPAHDLVQIGPSNAGPVVDGPSADVIEMREAANG
jgi:hypothetical protein